jgi:mono/diheme cytochrome c family protein
MLKPMLFVSALVLFALSVTSNAGPLPQEKGQPAAAGQTKLTEKAQARAKELYTQECALCHGDSGNGKTDLAAAAKMTLDDWTDPKALAGKSDKELFDLIRNGKGQMTPEPVGRAKDEEVRNLILFIRAMAKQPPAGAPGVSPAPQTPPAPATPPAAN